MKKIKVLSLTNKILEYRVPVYNRLNEFFDVTVAHYGNKCNNRNITFKEIILSPKTFGPFTYFNENIVKIAEQYDAVIALGDLHVFPYIRLGFLAKRKFALTYWSIGVSASYTKKFDENKKLDRIRFYLLNRADSIVFYTSYPIQKYVQYNRTNKNKLFVANNTIEVKERIEIPKEKKHFLFVGTLYKEKKIFDLLDAYKLADESDNKLLPLIIIGNGDEYQNICNWVSDNNLEHKIRLTGAIYEQDELREYYRDAIACISPGQAGLTVLNSMAYGVPFVTTKEAITGGEILNIKNNVNGIIYKESVGKLAEILQKLSSNQDYSYEMGKNAQDFYFNNSNMTIMVDGLRDAVIYAVSIQEKNEQNNTTD